MSSQVLAAAIPSAVLQLVPFISQEALVILASLCSLFSSGTLAMLEDLVNASSPSFTGFPQSLHGPLAQHCRVHKDDSSSVLQQRTADGTRRERFFCCTLFATCCLSISQQPFPNYLGRCLPRPWTMTCAMRRSPLPSNGVCMRSACFGVEVLRELQRQAAGSAPLYGVFRKCPRVASAWMNFSWMCLRMCRSTIGHFAAGSAR